MRKFLQFTSSTKTMTQLITKGLEIKLRKKKILNDARSPYCFMNITVFNEAELHSVKSINYA